MGVFGVFVVVVWWCQHPARELAFFGVLHLCGGVRCGGLEVFEMCIC